MDETVARPSTSLRVNEVGTSDCTEAVEMSALDLTDDDPNCSADMNESTHVTFELIDSASNKGYTLLVDTRGFSYCKKLTRGSKVYWRRSQRTKSVVCHATVIQDGDIFTLGTREHLHPPTAAARTIRVVRAQIITSLIYDRIFLQTTY